MCRHVLNAQVIIFPAKYVAENQLFFDLDRCIYKDHAVVDGLSARNATMRCVLTISFVLTA